MRYIPLGWPKNKVKLKKPKIVYSNKLSYLGSICGRNINIIINPKTHQIEENWYINKNLGIITARQFLKYNILKIFFYSLPSYIYNFIFLNESPHRSNVRTILKNNFLNYNFFKFFKIQLPLFFLNLIFLIKKKEKIVIKKGEIVIFGPYSWNYAHQIHEFLVRIAYLNSPRFHTIYLPHFLKKIILSKVYRSIFKNKNFKFYNAYQTIKFINVSYLTHIENRFINKNFSQSLNFLRSKILQFFKNEKIYSKSKKKKYLFISRKNSEQRKLINEDLLFLELSKIGFEKTLFENISVDDQIRISKDCKIMIGYHGAGISNCAYMNKNSILVEICNKLYPHPHFELFCKMLKIRYKRFYCYRNFKNLDGICDVSKILKFVKSIKKKKFN
jgi:hypothetical protein